MASHLLKADNKPNLFSWDLETENKSIDRWRLNNSKRDLGLESQMLRTLAKDFIEIIETKSISDQHLQNLKSAISYGTGVWEIASTKLELLSYHFDKVKMLIADLIRDKNSKIVFRSLTAVSNAFSTSEQLDIYSSAFNHKSKIVRAKTADMALETRNKELIPFLKQNMEKENDTKVKESIKFAIDNMWQPMGVITIQA